MAGSPVKKKQVTDMCLTVTWNKTRDLGSNARIWGFCEKGEIIPRKRINTGIVHYVQDDDFAWRGWLISI